MDQQQQPTQEEIYPLALLIDELKVSSWFNCLAVSIVFQTNVFGSQFYLKFHHYYFILFYFIARRCNSTTQCYASFVNHRLGIGRRTDAN